MISHSHIVKVFYKDVDKMGIVYYSRYFEYFEQSRTEMLNNIGLKYSLIEKRGVMLPVIEAYAKYIKNCTFEDKIIIQSIIEKIPKSRFKILYNIKRIKDGALIVEGYTIHVFLNIHRKPVRPPKFFIDKVKSYF
tara:strand:- start:85987 stop:86391 length:405 start_codon:yes stop_codon:yes gene_type:complete